MIEVKAPNRVSTRGICSVFMAGSIEMGTAEDWQSRFKREVSDLSVTLINPRRDDWDSSWVQSIHNCQFSQQVNWELDHIEKAALRVFYFDPATKSPITLMELGFVAAACPAGTLVCCPEGFWRKGNVDILCQRAGIPVVKHMEDLVRMFRADVEEWYEEA